MQIRVLSASLIIVTGTACGDDAEGLAARDADTVSTDTDDTDDTDDDTDDDDDTDTGATADTVDTAVADLGEEVVSRCPTLAPTTLDIGEGGLARFTVTGATAVDTDGLASALTDGALVVRAPWAPGDHELSATTDGDDCAPARATLHVRELEVARLDAGSGPAEREHPIFWIDPAAPDALLVGSGYLFEPQQFTPSWDLWSWDLLAGGWTRLEETRPEEFRLGLSGRVAAIDGGLLIQGGTGTATASRGRLIVRDGRGWRTLGEGAPETELQAFARIGPDDYISTLGLSELADGYAFARDVWRFRDGAWTALPFADNTRPSPRYGFAFAWDDATRRLIVAGGAGTPKATAPVNAADDTWVLQIGDDPAVALWSELDTEGRAPPVRNGCWAFDPDGRRLVVFGGTADGATAVPGMRVLELEPGRPRWIDLSARVDLPPSRASCTAAWDASRGRMLLGFGNSESAIYADLWALIF